MLQTLYMFHIRFLDKDDSPLYVCLDIQYQQLIVIAPTRLFTGCKVSYPISPSLCLSDTQAGGEMFSFQGISLTEASVVNDDLSKSSLDFPCVSFCVPLLLAHTEKGIGKQESNSECSNTELKLRRTQRCSSWRRQSSAKQSVLHNKRTGGSQLQS